MNKYTKINQEFVDNNFKKHLSQTINILKKSSNLWYVFWNLNSVLIKCRSM